MTIRNKENPNLHTDEKNAIWILLDEKKSSGHAMSYYISSMERIDNHTICVTFFTIRKMNVVVRGADLSWLPQYRGDSEL